MKLFSLILLTFLGYTSAFAADDKGVAYYKNGIQLVDESFKFLYQNLPELPSPTGRVPRGYTVDTGLPDVITCYGFLGIGSTCAVYAPITGEYAKELFNKLSKETEQTSESNEQIRNIGAFTCSHNSEADPEAQYVCYVDNRSRENDGTPSCIIYTRSSREMAPPARICIYHLERKLSETVDSDQNKIDTIKSIEHLFGKACTTQQVHEIPKCSPLKPSQSSVETGNQRQEAVR